MSKMVFLQYLNIESSYILDSDDIDNFHYSKFWKSGEGLDNISASTGELIIFYNNLILEILFA